jgi:hypothetical protein
MRDILGFYMNVLLIGEYGRIEDISQVIGHARKSLIIKENFSNPGHKYSDPCLVGTVVAPSNPPVDIIGLSMAAECGDKILRITSA